MGFFADTFGAIKEWKDGESDKEFAKKQLKESEKDHWDRINAQNFDYAKPSDSAPEYKATQSPVARAYLESFLTGKNVDAVQGTRLGSSGLLGDKAKAQASFNQAYGGWDQLQKKGEAELMEPGRFAVKKAPGANELVTKDQEEASLSSKNPQNAPMEKTLGRRLSADEIAYLNKTFKFDKGLAGKTGTEHDMLGNTEAWMIQGMSKKGLEKLLADRPNQAGVKTVEPYARMK